MKSLCEECADKEMAMAWDCYEKARAAEAKGEAFECTCPPLPCETDEEHFKAARATPQSSEPK